MLIYLPQIVMIIGLIVWFALDQPKVTEAGRLAFFAGLLATCLKGFSA